MTAQFSLLLFGGIGFDLGVFGHFALYGLAFNLLKRFLPDLTLIAHGLNRGLLIDSFGDWVAAVDLGLFWRLESNGDEKQDWCKARYCEPKFLG